MGPQRAEKSLPLPSRIVVGKEKDQPPAWHQTIGTEQNPHHEEMHYINEDEGSEDDDSYNEEISLSRGKPQTPQPPKMWVRFEHKPLEGDPDDFWQ